MVKTIVVIGGGFAGINFALSISRNRNYRVIVADKNNYNYFTPLIYQVATGFLETSSISYPFRKLFRHNENIRFRLGEFIRVDAEEHTCYFDNGEIVYDYLVFATGAIPNYFGNENIKANAIPMKTINDALQMRNILLQTLENAARTSDRDEQRKLLTFVIAGAGPTGVEVSGMLAELRKYVLLKDYPELIGARSEIYLLDGTPNLLTQMSPQSQQETQETLHKLGVEIRLNCIVKDFTGDKVILDNGETIDTKSLIWTAGVVAAVFEGIPEESIGAGKRMLTDTYNRVKGLIDVYAIGDTALIQGDNDFPKGHPQLAQSAIQQGKNLARNFDRVQKEKSLVPFRYKDKGTMAITGRNRAVADLTRPTIHIGGFPALLIWLFVHLAGLISWRNKMRTLLNWIAAYFTRDQSLRLIVRPSEKKGNQNNNQQIRATD